MPFGNDIYALLTMADEHGAKHLRAACMDAVLSHGHHLLEGPALSALHPPVLVELLLDASRRRPPPPPPVPTGAFAVPIEITSDEEPPAPAKRKAKRKTDGDEEPRRRGRSGRV